ncbi:hypothetical protein IKA15_03890 [bacterium]|nr:hypothetical protein [bacterium]
MKHILALLLSIFLVSPVFAGNLSFSDKTEGQFFETLKGDTSYTEIVLPQYEIISSDEDKIIEYMDIINLEDSLAPKFNSDIKSPIGSFGAKYENPNEARIKQGDFVFASSIIQNKNDYFQNRLKQRTELKYQKEYFELSSGYETSYASTDASKRGQTVFIEPKLKFGKRFSLKLNNSVNPTTQRFTQEFGVSYTPKYIKNSNFGISNETTFGDNSIIKQRMNFTSNFFIW